MKKYFSIGLIAIGVLCNFLAVAFNGGKMPTKVIVETHYVGGASGVAQHFVMLGSPKFPILCDILYFGGRAYSVGDVFIVLGIVACCAYVLGRVYAHAVKATN